ncbi:MAG: branched-chain amino acid ABC transporter substrate-binding protein [Burkholderiales bacterium]|nr:MAG: branched-chain amino acid ABC transporter substrate-binding protein [Burkholderiales bacterium]
MKRKFLAVALAGLTAALVGGPATAQKKYDPGATDKEIKIGGISPYSGPASAYGAIGKAIDAYFKKINAEGGINGRQIKFISLDDGYNPARTVEQARKLVEQEEVLLLFNTLGTPPNSAIHKYMNQKKVPQLFVATGATLWGDPKNFPWTMGWQPNYQAEGKNYALHILENKPNAKIGILMQNDDYGRDYLKGFLDGLGDKAKTMIVKQVTYEVTDPTVDSQMVELKGSGADTFFNITTPKFAAQAIKKAAEIGWKPTHYLNSVSNAAGTVMVAAGAEAGIGVISAFYLKDPTDPQWGNSKEYKDWLAFMQKYHPQGDLKDNFNVFGYSVAQTLEQVLKQAGDNLTRENIMKQAASLDFSPPMLLPGVNVKTAADDFFPIEREQLARWDGKTWVLFGKVIGR